MGSIKMCDLTVKMNIALIMLLISTVSTAEMYKWVDENGDTHYSQSPPVSDVKVEKIAPPPAVDPSNAQQDLQRTVEKVNSLREERLVARENQEKEKDEEKRKKEQCQQLKESLNSLTVRPRANKVDEEGNLVRMTEEERQEKIENTKQQMKEKCS
ncbi:MAG: DUF4124 domain-containing protein [Proteobacteria bacterium]|nr:DUF4124 domain-containing protein [Pseudomonadota bacterium]NOG61626.1 DUF4124 domain-containing protein [Pseudomonadota bacterium]